MLMKMPCSITTLQRHAFLCPICRIFSRRGRRSEALSHEHLKNALLALSASHLANLHADLPLRALYKKKARYHHYLALTSSISELIHIDEENCHALFATSGIVAFLAFVPQSPSNDAVATPLGDMYNVFVLVRGIKTGICILPLKWLSREN